MAYLLDYILTSQLSRIIERGGQVDVRVQPFKLIKQLSEPRRQQQLTHMYTNCKEQDKMIRVMTVMNIILINSDQFYDLLKTTLNETNTFPTWIGCQVLAPLQQFIKRCADTSQLFILIKQFNLPPCECIERLPYILKILKSILNIAQNIPRIGRYFSNKNKQMYKTFCQSIMLIVNHIYCHLKNSIEQVLYQQIETENQPFLQKHKETWKWFFAEQLPKINQKIRQVTLNKYFMFYKKGIVTKLFKTQEQSEQIQQLINDLIKGDKQNSESIPSLKRLQTEIFPADGSFNSGLFLSSIQNQQCHQQTLPSQTLNLSVVNLKQYKLKSKTRLFQLTARK